MKLNEIIFKTVVFLSVCKNCFSQTNFIGTCGRQYYQPATNSLNKFFRILGGHEAVPHSWPWTVSLRESNGFHFCGATLLLSDKSDESDTLLTAAHCMLKK